jgi:hypothetical protein
MDDLSILPAGMYEIFRVVACQNIWFRVSILHDLPNPNL